MTLMMDDETLRAAPNGARWKDQTSRVHHREKLKTNKYLGIRDIDNYFIYYAR